MLTRTVVVAALAAALVATGAAAAAHTASHHKKGTVVKLHKTSLGKVLANGKGRTLYLYTPDPKGKSVCTGACASTWPPLIAKGKPRAGKGVKKKLLGVIMRSDGKHQVTYKGHPLYLYVGDSKAGQVNGEGTGGIWYVVSSSGKKVTGKQSTSTTTTTGGGGYGSGY